MSITAEVISSRNKESYGEYLNSEYIQLLNNPNFLLTALNGKHSVMALAVIELREQTAIIIRMEFIHSKDLEDYAYQSVIIEVEKLVIKRGIHTIFWFQSNPEIAEILVRGNWITVVSQIEYVLSPRIFQSKSSPLPHLNVLKFKEINTQNLINIVNTINLQLKSEVDKIPPLNFIDIDTSYFLIFENQIIGWFTSTIQNDLTLSISRFFVREDFRILKVSTFFLNSVFWEIFQDYRYKKVSFNIMSNNQKLKRIVESGFGGEVLNKTEVYKSYKILN